MARWECGSCGLVETLRIVPDCCSACGGSVFSDDFDYAAADAVEAFCIEAQDRAYAGETTHLGYGRVAGQALLGLAGLVLLVAAIVVPTGMDVCRERHSLDTCHHALFR